MKIRLLVIGLRRHWALVGMIADKDEIIAKQLQIINRQKETLQMVVEQRDALMARETEG